VHVGECGKTPKKSISGAAAADARTACTADYSGDHADACRRPRRLSDTATAGTAECLPTRDATGNDRQDTGSIRHALTDSAANRFDADCAEPYKSTESKTSTLQNSTKYHILEINNLLVPEKQGPAPSPAVNANVRTADAGRGTPTADDDDGSVADGLGDGSSPSATDCD